MSKLKEFFIISIVTRWLAFLFVERIAILRDNVELIRTFVGSGPIGMWFRSFGIPPVITSGIACALSDYWNWCLWKIPLLLLTLFVVQKAFPRMKSFFFRCVAFAQRVSSGRRPELHIVARVMYRSEDSGFIEKVADLQSSGSLRLSDKSCLERKAEDIYIHYGAAEEHIPKDDRWHAYGNYWVKLSTVYI